jgi:hypothetical protein
MGCHEYKTGHTDSQPGDVQHTDTAVFPEVAEGEFEVVG